MKMTYRLAFLLPATLLIVAPSSIAVAKTTGQEITKSDWDNFFFYDFDSSHTLDMYEYVQYATLEMGVNTSVAANMFVAQDANKDWKLDYYEFGTGVCCSVGQDGGQLQ